MCVTNRDFFVVSENCGFVTLVPVCELFRSLDRTFLTFTNPNFLKKFVIAHNLC